MHELIKNWILRIYLPVNDLRHMISISTQGSTESSSLGVLLPELLVLSSSTSRPQFPRVERIDAGSSGVSSLLVLSLRIKGWKKGMEAAIIVQLTSTEFKAQTTPPS